ncbi:2'-5' RNA ligase family protein [Herpetosiphon llansteffanensis]|uniref:2'-5' RNA ligase family protein n=1 Tax=Herpetosiphon llansteffanensis TaxID=2094568 RepID=UPI000D7BB55D|nr:2'-5' RNA ligase family protein [Herpetosiphon llansteffanensis]
MPHNPTTIFLTLYFDPATEQAINRLWHILADAGIPVPGINGHRPHITIAAYDTTEYTPYQQLLGHFSQSQHAFPIRLHALGIFPETGVVFLAPRVTAPLLSLHTALLTACATIGSTPLKYAHHLGDSNWMPHCTLARGQTPAQVRSIVATCVDHWQAIDGMIAGIGILIPPTVVDVTQYAFASAPSSHEHS